MNTAKITCEIIKDLLPLYVDDVLSQESRQEVSSHLQNCKNGEIYFYLGENGLRSLGIGRNWMLTPKYQRLIIPALIPEITTVNYCKPDGAVIITLWKTGDELLQLK